MKQSLSIPLLSALVFIAACKKEDMADPSASPTAPKADYTYYAERDSADFLLHFDNASLHATAFQWNFGDNTSSAEENPVHIYENEGDYTVTLIASNAIGADTFSQLLRLRRARDPYVRFLYAGTGRTVDFTARAQHETALRWDFGDGAASESPNPQHTYASDGEFTVALTATGPDTVITTTKIIKITSGTPASVRVTCGEVLAMSNTPGLSSSTILSTQYYKIVEGNEAFLTGQWTSGGNSDFDNHATYDVPKIDIQSDTMKINFTKLSLDGATRSVFFVPVSHTGFPKTLQLFGDGVHLKLYLYWE